MRLSLVLTSVIVLFLSLGGSTQAQTAGFLLRPQLPPFLRPGDRMEFSFIIRNKAALERTGQSELQLTDAATGTSVDGWFQNIFPNQYFTAGANDSAVVRFPLEVPFTFFKTAQWRFFSRAGNDTAVASGLLPVLPNRKIFTETAMQHGSGTFSLPALLQSGHIDQLQHASVQVQMASSPAAFAYAALPSLLQQESSGISAVADKLFAAALLLQLVRNEPAAAQQILQAVTGKSNAAWSRQLTASTFLQQAVATSANLLMQQQKNGAFPLRHNSTADVNTTQYVTLVIGRLLQLQAIPAAHRGSLQRAAKQALRFLERSKAPVAQITLAYLAGLINEQQSPAREKIRITATTGMQPRGMQAKVAMLLWGSGDTVTSKQVLRLALQQKETSFGEPDAGLWQQQTIATSLLLEAAYQTRNTALADSLSAQLLQQKGPTGWPLPAATTSAVYALLLQHKAKLVPLPAAAVQLGNLPARTTEEGSYFYTNTLEAGLVQPALGNVAVRHSGGMPAITLVHWQYFAESTASTRGLTLNRRISMRKNNSMEPVADGTTVALGDILLVELEIDTDQPISNVQLTDGHPAGFTAVLPLKAKANKKEVMPVESIGKSTWMFPHLSAGKTKVAYYWKAVYQGSFSSGPARLQWLYSEKEACTVAAIRISIE